MSDSTLYLYTSLTAGSSHIVTATARLETILKANKLPFKAIDVATDDAARKLWGRKSKGKKLPGLVKFGVIVGDLEEIEEWNEFGELRMQVIKVEDPDNFIGSTAATAGAPDSTAAATAAAPAAAPAENPPPKQSTIKIQSPPAKETKKDGSITMAMRQAGEEAASKAKDGNTTEPKSGTESPAQEPNPEMKEPEPKEPSNEQPQTQQQSESSNPNPQPQTQSQEEQNVRPRRASNAPAPEVAVAEKGSGDNRPPLAIVPEAAAESSENFHADNAEALGIVEHHRESIVSATSDHERKEVARDLRESISGGRTEALDSLRAEGVEIRTEESIDDGDDEGGPDGSGCIKRASVAVD